VTGSVTSTEDTPYLPMSSEAILEAVVSSWRVGATVIDPRLGCNAILDLSVGGPGGRRSGGNSAVSRLAGS
jgi:hypothetical protein